MKKSIRFKHLSLILILLGIASVSVIHDKFPFENSSIREENLNKIFMDPGSLQSYYRDTLGYVKNRSCDKCVSIKEDEFRCRLKFTYISDIIFVFCYIGLFGIYFHRQLYGAKEQNEKGTWSYWFVILLLLITFIADLTENILMLKYIGNGYSGYNALIRVACVFKSLGFIILVYYLFIYNISSFIKLVRSYLKS
ncbi:MAG: hypothetical protein IPO86_16335 [Saprospiraceae bacterium]|nr:hypothetical protein [Saprospiraceae bacterium]